MAAALLPLSTLRYELAILQAPEAEEVPRLFLLTALLSVGAGAAIVVSSLALGALPELAVVEGSVPVWLFGSILGVGVTLSGLFAATSGLFLRFQDYKTIAAARLFQSVASVAVILVGGLLGAGPVGLLLSAVAAQGGGLLWHLLHSWKHSLPALSFRELHLWESARKYYRYALFICPASVLNVMGLTISAPAIAGVFGASAAGEFSLANRFTVLPVVLIGNSVSQVFMSRVAEAVRKGDLEQSRILFRHYHRKLVPFGLAVLTAGALSPAVFPFLFGAKWEMAGWYASLLSIPAALQIVVSPLSSVIYFSDGHRIQLLLDVARFILVLFAFYAAVFMIPQAHAAVAAVALAHTAAYAAYGWAYQKVAANLKTSAGALSHREQVRP